MDADQLWIESYQGEVLGESLFGILAEQEPDPDRRQQLEALTILERSTKELAEPILERRGLDKSAEATVASATTMAEAVAALQWEEFLRSFEPVITQFLGKYRELVSLSADDDERSIAEAYVAHELALAVFVRRALGEEEGEPLEAIFALPHVIAAPHA